MQSTANLLRFTGKAILLKRPVLVILTIVFMLALLSTHINTEIYPGASSSGGIGGWVGLAVLLIICALFVWMLCHSQEVVIDPATRRVTQWHRFLTYEVKKNEWDFSGFTGVRVERKADKSQSAATSSGSGGSYTSVKTTYTYYYTLSLLRADTVVATPDRQINVPHYPLELPVEERSDPLGLEAAARQLARTGGWPAKRRGYALVADASAGTQGGYAAQSMPHDAESPIDAG